ncbi:MAG TPA: farnesyl diphosphate synthase [Bdellovibrionota bacterium]|nr:farnesyl diphosphate synthase [Bdellovibrionota bacterium]
MARRDDDGVLAKLCVEEEQHSQPGCSGGRVSRYFGPGTLTVDLEKYLETCRRSVEGRLEEYFSTSAVAPRLVEAMKYSLFAGGKRIRPALALAACEAVGGKSDAALPVACALEMIHTYSLIHDDLPTMDNDDLRRGRPTNHKVFGEGLAILAGDALLTEAFNLLADPSWNIPAECRIDIVGIVAEGSGANGMVGGQVLDLQFEGKDVGEKELEQIHRNKTGKLLRAAVLAGGRAGGAEGEFFDSLKRYGEAIGLAFQIADDVLDVTATTKQLGKGAAKDQDKKKATYPAILGLDESRRRAANLLEDSLLALKPLGKRAEALTALARYIIERRS